MYGVKVVIMETRARLFFRIAMRWLWKDWPKPVTKGNSKNQFLSDLLIPGEEWELVGQGYKFTEGTAANAKGEVYYQDIPASKTYKVGLDGKLVTLNIDAKRASGTCFGPDGKRYTVAGGTKQILSYDANEKETVVADSIAGNDLVDRQQWEYLYNFTRWLYTNPANFI